MTQIKVTVVTAEHLMATFKVIRRSTFYSQTDSERADNFTSTVIKVTSRGQMSLSNF